MLRGWMRCGNLSVGYRRDGPGAAFATGTRSGIMNPGTVLVIGIKTGSKTRFDFKLLI